MSRICLVGAGNISQVHGQAIAALPGHFVSAVVDPNLAAAKSLAASLRGANAYSSIEAGLEDGTFDRAHVLVPPDLHHPVALKLLAAGKPLLLEKPLAATGAECDELVAAAASAGTVLGVNQNFVHHPAFARLRRMVEARALGRPNWVGCVYNVPVRQMQARQFSHWMFRQPVNILLEQAVHPLSQIAALAGPITRVSAVAGPAIEIAPDVPFVATLDTVVSCQRLPAQLRFAVGQSFPFWQVTVVCEDGVIVADILANRISANRRTRWLPAVDEAASGLMTAGALALDSARNLLGYGMTTAKLRRSTDPFLNSMIGSIGAFHRALDAGQPPELDGAFGASLVAACEQMRDQALPKAAPRPSGAPRAPAEAPPHADIAVLGGTGFIGAHLVRRLLDAGLTVSVMARSATNLPAVFDDSRVHIERGDIRDQAAVERAIGDAPVVVNLAHGGGGKDFEAVRAAMVGGAETVARACLARGVRRLVHIGSIASLFLGPQPSPITDATPPDPEPGKRADYARAKVLADRMLIDMHAKEGLPVVILRPGVVVGEGTSPFHSGVGLYNNDQHCIGWNAGRNGLPFVLVEDVADAIYRAATAEGVEGRTYNIVGDVRLTAREYTHLLARTLGRPLRYHPQSVRFLWAEDGGKWLVKRATGRRVPVPTLRDFLSRGMAAQFDTTAAQKDLGWTPVRDPAEFARRAIDIHA